MTTVHAAKSSPTATARPLDTRNLHPKYLSGGYGGCELLPACDGAAEDRSPRGCLYAGPAGGATVAACRLCRIGASTAIWDRVLWETENFRVVPSKGGFVAGWLMVVPRAHVLSMAHLSPVVYYELDQLVADISARLTDRFGPPTAFEHGAVTENTSFGCGIDHAHLHVVPLSDDVPLRALAEQTLGKKFIFQPAAPTRAYLRVREPVDPSFGVLEPPISPPRQFFRQLIWRARAWHVHSYDYDLAPCREQVRATVAALGQL